MAACDDSFGLDRKYATLLGLSVGKANTMSKTHEYGCRKCGSVLKLDVHPWSDHVDIKVKDGRIHDHAGTLEFQCKKCGRAVVMLTLMEAR